MLVVHGVLRLLAPVLLHLSHCQTFNLLNRNYTMEALPFSDVLHRSVCRPLEKLVNILTEYPSEIDHMFSPSCVPLQRCAGCCGDERLQCVAVETANVTMELLKVVPGQNAYMELSFIEHRRCECRPRRNSLKLNRQKMRSGEKARKRERSRGQSVKRMRPESKGGQFRSTVGAPSPGVNCIT
ncbi:hypothetical protein NDU88_002035 [Pleurodeles waltl]|uniref:Platelet-derived growth factor (PDGF) family profile domain-containing protein n=2 Tax=Pleurodeles waltl TaxID=8319 RepID=A0AAV7MLI5_PLEWA|nr:hypothetical protein NDU88_002035 [Pleurodeles waltl]